MRWHKKKQDIVFQTPRIHSNYRCGLPDWLLHVNSGDMHKCRVAASSPVSETPGKRERPASSGVPVYCLRSAIRLSSEAGRWTAVAAQLRQDIVFLTSPCSCSCSSEEGASTRAPDLRPLLPISTPTRRTRPTQTKPPPRAIIDGSFPSFMSWHRARSAALQEPPQPPQPPQPLQPLQPLPDASHCRTQQLHGMPPSHRTWQPKLDTRLGPSRARYRSCPNSQS